MPREASASLEPAPIAWAARFPPPSFDVEALTLAAANNASAALRAVRGNTALPRPPSWPEAANDLATHLAPLNAAALLGPTALPLDLLEPQITKALAAYLEPCFRHGPARIDALLHATSLDPSASSLPVIHNAAVHAEAPTLSGDRIDILAYVDLADGSRRGVVIEAKVCHQLTTGQLGTYAAAARDEYQLDEATCLVVAPALDGQILRELRANPGWQFMSWRSFLSRLGAALAYHGCDDVDFARFRRHVFAQTV